jgi:hypothetical protein
MGAALLLLWFIARLASGLHDGESEFPSTDAESDSFPVPLVPAHVHSASPGSAPLHSQRNTRPPR